MFEQRIAKHVIWGKPSENILPGTRGLTLIFTDRVPSLDCVNITKALTLCFPLKKRCYKVNKKYTKNKIKPNHEVGISASEGMQTYAEMLTEKAKMVSN